MSKQKVTQVTVQGLATNPNPNALPAGSCAVATNVISRRPGILTPSPTTKVLASAGANDRYIGKMIYADATNQVEMVLIDNEFPPTFPPGTLELYTGALQAFTANQTTVSVDDLVDSLPVATDGTTRDIGWIPALAESAFSHFRTLITEKWGIMVNAERWAGLPPPPDLILGVSGVVGFLEQGNAVAYRTNWTLESTDPDKPFIINGPVSAISAITNVGLSNTNTFFNFYPPANEPYPFLTNLDLYLNVYRCTQAEVDTVADLSDDFRRVAKYKLVQSDFTTPATLFTKPDTVSEDARNAGVPLYTNAGQEGPQADAYAPPTARDICVFKDTVFYANRSALPTLNLTIPGKYGTLISLTDYQTGIGIRPFVTASTVSGNHIVTFSDPNEIVGVETGMVITGLPGGDVTVVSKPSSSTLNVTPAPNATSNPVSGSIFDMLTITANYADGTTETVTGRIILFDQDMAITGGLPGFRLLHPAVDPSEAVEGITLVVIAAWPAIKRVVNFDVYVTNGANYSPAFTGSFNAQTSPLVSIVDNRPNRVFYSKTGEPEAVPPGNFLDVGAGTILKMWANLSALFVFCTDGLWKITGDGTDWAVYQVDPTALLLHPACVTSLNNKIYAWVTDGIAIATESECTTISTDAVGPYMREQYTAMKPACPYLWGPALVADQFFNELWLLIGFPNTSEDPGYTTPIVIYNDDSKNFTTYDPNFLGTIFDINTGPIFNGLVYSPDAARLLYGFLTQSGEPIFAQLLGAFDFYPETEDVPYEYLSTQVWFNPLQTDEKGNLKQWMDVNFFTANYKIQSLSDDFQALFNNLANNTDPNSLDPNSFPPAATNSNNMLELSRDIHFWVPRRAALADQIQIGFQSYSRTGTIAQAYYFELQGFTLRYRVASDTLKR